MRLHPAHQEDYTGADVGKCAQCAQCALDNRHWTCSAHAGARAGGGGGAGAGGWQCGAHLLPPREPLPQSTVFLSLMSLPLSLLQEQFCRVFFVNCNLNEIIWKCMKKTEWTMMTPNLSKIVGILDFSTEVSLCVSLSASLPVVSSPGKTTGS